MKVLFFAILDHNQTTEALLRKISQEGYNGTVIPTSGLHHVLPKFNDANSAAVSLATMVDDLPSGNFTLFVILDEEKVEKLTKTIQEGTGNWKKAKGGTFVLPLLSVEGTF